MWLIRYDHQPFCWLTGLAHGLFLTSLCILLQASRLPKRVLGWLSRLELTVYLAATDRRQDDESMHGLTVTRGWAFVVSPCV